MGELSLSTLANLAEIIGAGSIVTGLAQQRDAVAINLAQTFSKSLHT